jgi:NAD(P)-dependent dehydrogenase (short-subunit alcohol dehydrogenase family)
MPGTASEQPVAIVTGGAQGIGRACVESLESEGWLVAAGDLRTGNGVRLCDVRSTESVAAFVEDVLEQYERIDALVAAAGSGTPVRFLEADDELWRESLDVNLLGTVRVCRAALPALRASTYSARGVVTFTSQAAKTGGLLIGAPYSAAKAAVLCLTKTLAGEFGSDGVRVNAVAPGIIDTAFLDGVPGIRDHADQLPLRRIGTAEEVASVVAFLLSPGAIYITGEIVDVNGGLYMD